MAVHVVTGAHGFLGTHLCASLEADGAEVIRVGRDADARNAAALERKTPRDAWVWHLAAEHGGVGWLHGRDVFRENSKMTWAVLGLRAERIFLASSACAYGTNRQYARGVAPRLNEHADLWDGPPDGLYGLEKRCMVPLAETSPGDVRIGVLHTVVGPGQSIGERAKFPPAAAAKALQARTTGRFDLWGDGTQLRSYLHVADAIARMRAVMFDDRYDGPVNVGYDGAVSCLDVARLMCELAGVDPSVIACRVDAPTGPLGRDCDNTLFGVRYPHVPEPQPWQAAMCDLFHDVRRRMES